MDCGDACRARDMGKSSVIFLDTNVLVRALVAGTSEAVVVEQYARAQIPLRVSLMVWAEFLCGPATAQQVSIAAALVGEPEPLCVNDAKRAAELFNSAGRRRGSLADCLIAATCMRCNAPLMTRNLRDFARFENLGLRIVN